MGEWLARAYWTLVWRTPLKRVRWFRWHSTKIHCAALAPLLQEVPDEQA